MSVLADTTIAAEVVDTLNTVDPYIASLYAEGTTSGATVSTPTFGLMLFQMILMLLLLSAILYFALYFVRKLNYKAKSKNEHFSFKHHENLYLSQKQGLSAVSFGDKLYIIGFSPHSINLIDTIDDPEILAKLTEETSTPSKFVELLKNYFNKGKQ